MDTGPKHLVIFDMDGVIVDVSESYRESTRRTARTFFQGAAAYDDLPNPLFSLKDLAALKQRGGLNNDWDTTYLVISLLLTQVELPDTLHPEDAWRLHQEIMGRCDLSKLTSFLKSHPCPLKTLLQQNHRIQSNFVSRLSSGDVGSGNLIKQIFQEIYLGRELFEMIYGTPARMHQGGGLINQERLLIDPRFLELLAEQHILAIATGRPKVEAIYALKRFKLHDYFHSVLTLDDCIEEENRRFTRKGERIPLSKPHPFMLNAIAQSLTGKVKKNYYIGDMPDDMAAARNAKTAFIGVGVISPSPDRQQLKHMLLQAGADYVIETIQDLEKILSSAARP
jgi:phosphoglycolate phosphatase-like HAD superfamily hydrolase